VRLVCLPYAGGGSNVYRSWRTALPATVELCLAQLPGREVRFKEPVLTRVEPIVTALTQALRPLASLPLVIFGHSMGALLAFELARALEREGGFQLEQLCVSGRAAPHVRDREPLHALPEDQFLAAVRRLNGTPEEVFASPELIRLVSPMLRADFAVDETHQVETGAVVSCPVLAIGGSKDTLVPAGGLEAWQQYTRGPFQTAWCEGDHFFLNHNRAALFSHLAPVLSRVTERAA
jgi:medium-chain acyl-[acyl-carrier-protein] hydrolase